jgi:hypothetical protein
MLSSGTQYYYVPSTQNVPLFTKKHQANLSGYVGRANSTDCVDVQAAYAATNNIAVIANYMKCEGGNDKGPNASFAKGRNYEVGLGYYKCFDDLIVLQTFIGAGRNKQSHIILDGNGINPSFSNILNGTKLFVMPTLGLKGKYVEAALTYAITNQRFTRMDSAPTINTNPDEIITLQKNKSYTFFEPGFTFKAGARNFKFVSQFVFCEPRISAGFFAKEKFSVGLVYQLNNWRK